jgi:hypothetical protein
MMRPMVRLACLGPVALCAYALALGLLALGLGAMPSRVSAQTRFADELPDEADSGPNERERAVAASRPDRPHIDYSDPELPVYFRIGLGGGGVFENSSLDDTLATHGFARSPAFFRADVTVAGRALSWLWFGGRIGATGRGWGRRDGLPSAQATGFDLLAIAHLRFQLGRVFELGGMVGAGIGVAVLTINDQPTVGPAPRLMGGLEIGLRLGYGTRVLLHGEVNYFPYFDLDRYGSDLELGGGSVSLVLEVRL